MSEAPAAEAEISEETREKARGLGWEEGLIELALSKGHTMVEVGQALAMNIDGATAAQFLQGEGPVFPKPSLAWMNVPTEWGIRARASDPAMGLTIGDLNVGTYGDIPDHWTNRSEIPRGAFPASVQEDMGYTIFDKAVLWADCVVPLYETAIKDRWISATDLNWASLEELPDDIERAVCQLMTELSDRAYFQSATIGSWLPEMSYGYHEVKFFLSTVIFDLARHTEAFRKRALTNGGGLGLQAPTDYNRAIKEARSFPELANITFVQDSTLLTLFKNGELIAQNQLERDLYAFCARDRQRLMDYHVERLKHFLFKLPERREEQNMYFNKGEFQLAKDWSDPVVSEPLAVLLGGGKSNLEAGKEKLKELRKLQLQDYQANLAKATFYRSTLNPRMQAFLDA
ncbi:hypothetical protein AYO38_02790 [bacterium SCGC AG-212-C10]|nr:hypothetical protein AYO38_02790 [bacterium SCGC AG-212-C10]